MEDPQSPLIFWVAIYGAVLSTATLIWYVLRDVVLQRGKIKVRMKVEEVFVSPKTIAVLRVLATNVGRQPISVAEFGAHQRTKTGSIREVKNRSYGRGPNLPNVLAPGETIEFSTSDLELGFEPVETYFVRDGTGRIWKASLSDMRCAFAECNRIEK